MLEFKRLEIKNFLSHKHTEIEFLPNTLTLILGENLDSTFLSSNGSGKSTIFEALFWCIYGKTSRGLRGNETISRFKESDENSLVILDFIWQGEEFRITRGRTKSRIFFSINQIDGKETSFEFPISPDLFLSAIYFPQERFDTFCSSSDSFRKKILMEILSLEKYQTYQDLAKILKGKIEDKVQAEENTQKAIEILVISLENQILEAEKQLSISKEEIIDQHEVEKRKILSQKQTLVHERSVTENKKKHLEERLNKIPREDLRTKFETFHTGILALEREIKRKEGQLNQLNAICPLCEQPVPSSQKEKLKGAIPYKELKVKKDKEESYSESLAKIEANYFKLFEEKNLSEKSLFEMEKEFIELKTKLTSTSKAMVEKLELIQKSVNQIENLKNLLIEKEKEKIDSIEKEKTLLGQLGLVQFWFESFSPKGIPSFLMDQSLPFLNEKGQEYLSFLAPELDLSFDTRSQIKSGEQREKFSISIDEDERRYFSLSGGERKRVDLAILLSLAKYMKEFCPVNFIFLDEIFTGLDEMGCEGILELLQHEKQTDQSSVFVITHLDHLQTAPIWDRVLQIQKRNGISEIIEK